MFARDDFEFVGLVRFVLVGLCSYLLVTCCLLCLFVYWIRLFAWGVCVMGCICFVLGY